MAPKLSAHSDKILLNDALFQRVNTLYDNRMDLDLDNESVRLIEISAQLHQSWCKVKCGTKGTAQSN